MAETNWKSLTIGKTGPFPATNETEDRVKRFSGHLILVLVVLALGAAAGCGGSQSTAPPPPTVGKLYVSNSITSTILRFNAGDSGNVTPLAQAQLSPSVLGRFSIDVPHDRLAALSVTASPILLFDNVSTSLFSVRAIDGAATTLTAPAEIALDGPHDLLYATNGPSSILVFGPASTITGNVAPLRTITMGFTMGGIAVDTANDRLFVSDATFGAGALKIFDGASTLNGSVLPNRVISGAATQIATPQMLLLDSSGRLIVWNHVSFTPLNENILIFAGAAAANGNVAPAATVILSDSPQAQQWAVSPTGDLYVTNLNPSLPVYNIATASGRITPIRTIAGPNTGLNGVPGSGGGAEAIALDPTR